MKKILSAIIMFSAAMIAPIESDPTKMVMTLIGSDILVQVGKNQHMFYQDWLMGIPTGRSKGIVSPLSRKKGTESTGLLIDAINFYLNEYPSIREILVQYDKRNNFFFVDELQEDNPGLTINTNNIDVYTGFDDSIFE